VSDRPGKIPIVKAQDVYRVAAEELGPWLHDSGFGRKRRAKDPYVGAGFWAKPLSPSDKERMPERIVVAFQAYRSWDPLSGGKFTVEIEAGRRERLTTWLNGDEWDLFREQSLKALAKLPDWQFVDMLRQNLTETRRGQGDPWFHFVDEDDLRSWMPMLRYWIPNVIVRVGRAGSLRHEFIQPRWDVTEHAGN
jgi:hypothetical protein